jgi:hypothetical protein
MERADEGRVEAETRFPCYYRSGPAKEVMQQFRLYSALTSARGWPRGLVPGGSLPGIVYAIAEPEISTLKKQGRTELSSQWLEPNIGIRLLPFLSFVRSSTIQRRVFSWRENSGAPI